MRQKKYLPLFCFVDCNEFEKMLRHGMDVEFLLEWIKNIYEQFSVVVSMKNQQIPSHDKLYSFSICCFILEHNSTLVIIK